MNIFRELAGAIQGIVLGLHPDAPPQALARITVEPPRDPAHGDAATNAAMVLAKPLGKRPPELAGAIAAALRAHPWIAAASAAGPGFINLAFRPDFLRAQLGVILRAGTAYGDSAVLAGERINVEYVSANPTGPLHIGHCRGAVVGDALASLLAKAGAEVTREYYINDAGAQVEALAWATYWRYLQAIGTPLSEEEYSARVPGGLQYRGDYLIPVGRSLAAAEGARLAAPGALPAEPARWFAPARDAAVAAMMAAIRADLARLGIRHDVFTSEAALVGQGAVAKALQQLEREGRIYDGVLDPPKGKVVEDFEPRVQKLFRATAFGDDIDRPLQKSDGSYTYFANDIAYHADKYARGFARQIDVWGADHGGYVRRMQAAVAALTDGAGTLEILLCQIVRVLKSGEPYRMSKRAGTFVTLADLIDEVGPDVVRFIMLTRKSDAQMDFDIDAVQQQSRDNPVFYLQYAHARCRSVLRHAAIGDVAVLADADTAALSDEAEMALIRTLCAWPRVAESAAMMREPHRVPYYLAELAAGFHALWNKGRDEAALRFIQADDPSGTRARLALVAATAAVIASGLAVLGVTPVEEMR